MPAAIADDDTIRGDFPRQVKHRLHFTARRDQQLPAVLLPLQLGIDKTGSLWKFKGAEQVAVDRQTVRHQRHLKLAHQLHRRLIFHQTRGKIADRQRLAAQPRLEGNLFTGIADILLLRRQRHHQPPLPFLPRRQAQIVNRQPAVREH